MKGLYKSQRDEIQQLSKSLVLNHAQLFPSLYTTVQDSLAAKCTKMQSFLASADKHPPIMSS